MLYVQSVIVSYLYGYPQCLVRMARFRGTTKEEFIDNQRAEGNIYELLDAAMAFFLSISHCLGQGNDTKSRYYIGRFAKSQQGKSF